MLQGDCMKKYTKVPLVIGMLLSMPACFSREGHDMNKRVTLPSRLQYEVIKASEDKQAKSPTKGNTVTVHYTGWIADENGNPIMDRKFDSSIDRGQPFQFVIGVGQVIKGWDEGVMLMQVGDKRRLVIPAELGYGRHGYPPIIPSNATLVFDVELLNVG